MNKIHYAQILSSIFAAIIFIFSLSCSQKLHEEKSNLVIEEKNVIVDSITSVDKNINVRIKFTHYYPYCGGATPNESQMNNYILLSNTNFILIDLVTENKTLVQTNSSGFLELNLLPGRYAIQETYKNCSFEEFMAGVDRNADVFVEELDEDCYRKWWKSMLGEFTVVADEKLELAMGTASQCFTGINPCTIYNGPIPP